MQQVKIVGETASVTDSFAGTSNNESYNSSLASKIRTEFLTFFYTLQSNSIKRGPIFYMMCLVLQTQMLWNFTWIPLMDGTSFGFGYWGSWVFTVINYPNTFSMNLLSYNAAIAACCIFVGLLLTTITMLLIGYRSVKTVYRYLKKVQFVINLFGYLTLFFATPATFAFTSFIDCNYGYEAPTYLLSAQQLASIATNTTSNVLYSTPMLNRFPGNECFSNTNIGMIVFTMLVLLTYLIVVIIATLLLPKSHPLSNSPMISDSALFHISLSVCNVFGSFLQFIIPMLPL